MVMIITYYKHRSIGVGVIKIIKHVSTQLGV